MQTADNALTPPRFTYSSAPGNFRLINFQNSSENILPTLLVAQIYSDTGQRVVNWAAGNVVLPTPDQDQSITWNANAQQLGRGANKIQLDGGSGNVTVPGTLSVTGSTTCASLSSTSLQVGTAGIGTSTMGSSNQTGQIVGVYIDHAILLRGDMTTAALNHSITPGSTCAFVR